MKHCAASLRQQSFLGINTSVRQTGRQTDMPPIAKSRSMGSCIAGRDKISKLVAKLQDNRRPSQHNENRDAKNVYIQSTGVNKVF